jgi:cytidylate kinase
MVITIDGPVASGKSSVAQELANRLNFYYLNTGLLYRSIAYILSTVKHKVLEVEPVRLLTIDDLSFVQDLIYEYSNGKPHIFYDGQEITSALYAARMDQGASIVSACPVVRQALLSLQRSIAQKHDLVADGRDCGSVIFPQAEIKFFLTADVDVRAHRLYNDPRRNVTQTFDDIKTSLIQRDERDRTRAIAPLVIPNDAIVIDNSALTFDQTVDIFMREISARKKIS